MANLICFRVIQNSSAWGLLALISKASESHTTGYWQHHHELPWLQGLQWLQDRTELLTFGSMCPHSTILRLLCYKFSGTKHKICYCFLFLLFLTESFYLNKISVLLGFIVYKFFWSHKNIKAISNTQKE